MTGSSVTLLSARVYIIILKRPNILYLYYRDLRYTISLVRGVLIVKITITIIVIDIHKVY